MLLTGHMSRAIFDRYNIIHEQELLDAGDQLVEYLAQQAQAGQPVGGPTRPVPPPRAPHHPSASYDAAPRKGQRGAAGAGHRPPVRRGSRTGHRCTNRPAIVAHAATGRADAAEHRHVPGTASGIALNSGATRDHRLSRHPWLAPL